MEPELLDRDIVTVPDVLDAAECARFIAFAEGIGFRDAPITTARGFVHRPDIRNNTRVMLDQPDLAAVLWPRVRAAVPERLGSWQVAGLNERLRFYRYDPGQSFRWHHDGAFVRSTTERSFLTLMVYLNEGFGGGATEFDRGEASVRPRRGMALLFHHPILHQGAPVTEGRKYVLRSDVMYRQ